MVGLVGPPSESLREKHSCLSCAAALRTTKHDGTAERRPSNGQGLMRARFAAFGPIVLFVGAACGGRVERGVSGEGTGRAPSSSEAEEPTEPPLPEDGEWGTWQLIAVDTDDGTPNYDPPFIEIDLHETGKAYFWECLAAATGSGKRCPYPSRRGCLVGTISVTGATWQFHFPSKDGSSTSGRGVIVDEPSGDITVKGEGVVPARGHYRRVSPRSYDGCSP